MGFSEQEEGALNSSDESESVVSDSADVEAELTDTELDSAAEDEAALESEGSPAESEQPEADSDSSPDDGEELEPEKPSEGDLEDAESEDVEMEAESAEQEQPETEELSETVPPDAELSDTELESANEQIEEPEADEALVEGEAAVEQEQIEPEELADAETPEAESPDSELESADEQTEVPGADEALVEGEAAVEQEQLEPEELAETDTPEEEVPDTELETADEQIANIEADEALVAEGAAALISEIEAEVPKPVLEPEPAPQGDEDTSDVSLDFLDQDQTGALEEEDGRSWFVVHCYSGYENKVRHNLEQRIETMGMKDKIFDIVVPTEEEIEVREGKRRTVERRVFPGYILVNMIMTEESWYVVRNTPGVTGFVGMGNTPTALRPEEVSKIIKRMEAEAPRIKVTFKTGERVRIVDGPFNDFRGTVSEIDMEKAKVRVMVNFFGRETPVELDFLQVEKT